MFLYLPGERHQVIMDVQALEILSAAHDGSAPSNWVILPLRRERVVRSMLEWGVGILLGLGLFTGLFLATWPENFTNGAAGAIITGLMLVVLGFLGFGSLWLFLADLRRLLRANRSIIVLTPNVFCKQEGGKIDLVPLEEIAHITIRGTAVPTNRASWATYNVPASVRIDPEDRRIPNSFGLGRMVWGSASARDRSKNRRGPTSVAFVDLRTEKQIIVTNDHSYAHPYELGETLRSFVEARLERGEE
jgi:hypothetical protein